MTRHEARFGITSFIYRARRPFHPGRLGDLLLEPFFSEMAQDDDDKDDDDKEETLSEEKTKKKEENKSKRLQEIQKEAAKKQVIRTKTLGELLRSKGFLWIATSHDVIGGWQQAGNVIRLEAENPWMCDPRMRGTWEGTPSEELVMKDMKQPNGEEHKYADRRQEIVFIGQKMKHEVIQKVLDLCLLTDEEMTLGPDKWKETMAGYDKFQLTWEEAEEEGEEEEEGSEEDSEGEEDDEKDEEKDKKSGAPPTKKMKKSN